MSIGLMALLDDVAAIAKVAAASLDDVASQAVKAGAKAAGVVIDDTAVTPGYVIGFAARRELPIVGKIAAGSLRNKLLILFFFSSRRRHTRCSRDWSSDVCSSD